MTREIGPEWERYMLTMGLDEPMVDAEVRLQCRRAFYAGAYTIMRMIDVKKNIPSGRDLYDDLCSEIRDFRTAIGNGKA